MSPSPSRVSALAALARRARTESNHTRSDRPGGCGSYRRPASYPIEDPIAPPVGVTNWKVVPMRRRKRACGMSADDHPRRKSGHIATLRQIHEQQRRIDALINHSLRMLSLKPAMIQRPASHSSRNGFRSTWRSSRRFLTSKSPDSSGERMIAAGWQPGDATGDPWELPDRDEESRQGRLRNPAAPWKRATVAMLLRIGTTSASAICRSPGAAAQTSEASWCRRSRGIRTWTARREDNPDTHHGLKNTVMILAIMPPFVQRRRRSAV